MTDAFGLAAVTRALQRLLVQALAAAEVADLIGQEQVNVTALPPDRLDTNGEASQLNLFCYALHPNGALRNTELPSRTPRGARRRNAPLALDLAYLLTAHSSDELHAEVLLGHAGLAFHERPVLTPEAIRALLSPTDESNLAVALATAGLDEQVEAVRITPSTLSADELARLWSALSGAYRPSLAYTASVALLEAQDATADALPVQRWDLAVRQLRQPRLERVRAADDPAGPIQAGSTVVLEGARLRGEATAVRVGELLIEPDEVSDERLETELPADLRAGVTAAQVVHHVPLGDPPTPRQAAESNVVAFVLRPTIETVTAETAEGGAVRLTLTIAPAVGRQQRVVVLLDEVPPGSEPRRAYRLALPARAPEEPEASATVVADLEDVAAGAYLVRIQVDGAESPLSVGGDGTLDGPTVTVPA